MWCNVYDEHEYVPGWLQDHECEASTAESLRRELNVVCICQVGHPVGDSNKHTCPDDDITFGKFLVSETHLMNNNNCKI